MTTQRKTPSYYSFILNECPKPYRADDMGKQMAESVAHQVIVRYGKLGDPLAATQCIEMMNVWNTQCGKIFEPTYLYGLLKSEAIKVHEEYINSRRNKIEGNKIKEANLGIPLFKD